MRTTTKCILALGLVGAAALSAPSAASAQGLYFNGPGFGFGFGAPYYGYYEPYGYYGAGRYRHPYHYRHWRHH